MFRLLSKQVFKPVGVHHCRVQVHHPRRAISTTPGYNTGDGSNSGGSAGFTDDSQPGSASSVTWSQFSELGKDVSNIQLKFDHLESGQKYMKSDIKDLGSRLSGDIKELSSRVDRRLDKTDSKIDKIDGKIDRVLYGIITSLVGFLLKGGFDYYQDSKK